MLIETSPIPNNLTIRRFDLEGKRLLEAIDATVDPEDNAAEPGMMEILKQLWLKLHAAHGH